MTASAVAPYFLSMIEDELIERIQASGYRSVWAVTGGGITAVHAMLIHPGASRFVLDVHIPYSPEALEVFIGEKPASACSGECARKMAARALEKGTLGIACTAALQTNRKRKGADRAYVCIQSAEKTVCRKIDLEPAARAEQDVVLSEHIIRLLAGFLGVENG
ncbi:hypothetical protein EGM51_08830 [Verrucomicrobia bacterium S94]|nr:hypothetical protein EGM51_08830 [Verrucomicrobia bacterium S94]